jgi:hypothetical protein
MAGELLGCSGLSGCSVVSGFLGGCDVRDVRALSGRSGLFRLLWKFRASW